VSLVGPTATLALSGLLDAGSDDTVFPERYATQIGVDLTGAPTGGGSGTALGAAPLRYAPVKLRMAGAGEFREWPALVGFTPLPLRLPLLGFAGVM
jgi:hypothetical protein